VPYREIWRALVEDLGFRFSRQTVRENTPCEETTLFQCGNCDLQFFDPNAPGNPEFYRALGENPLYYSPWKWEFGWTISRLSPSAEVLDVGCGRGDFLAALREKSARAVGLDESETAVLEARSRGLDALAGDLSAHADAFEGAFTDVCAFHVLEHLTDPAGFVSSLRRCLRPGGSLFLSVPNRARSGRSAFEPLDCPPHHVTRWSPEALQRLARGSGFRTREIALEPVELSVPRDLLRERVRSAVTGIPAAGGLLGKLLPALAWRILLPAPLAALYRRMGLFERAGLVGMSVAARFTA